MPHVILAAWRVGHDGALSSPGTASAKPKTEEIQSSRLRELLLGRLGAEVTFFTARDR